MSRRLSFTIIIVFSLILLLFYQNVGVLSQNEKTKELVFPSYFSDVYKAENKNSAPSHEELAKNYLYQSPIYKQLSHPLFSSESDKNLSFNCSSSDNLCEKTAADLDRENNPPLSFSIDPFKTLAKIKMSEEWQGQVYYPSATGPRYELKRFMSQSSELNLQYDSGTNQGKISLDIKW